MVNFIEQAINGFIFCFILKDYYKSRYGVSKTKIMKWMSELFMICILIYSGIKSIQIIDFFTKLFFFFLYGKMINRERNKSYDFIFIIMLLVFQLGLSFLFQLIIDIVWVTWNDTLVILKFAMVFSMQIYVYEKMKGFLKHEYLEKAYLKRIVIIPIITGLTFLFLIQVSMFYVETSYQLLCLVVTLSMLISNILLLINMNKELIEEKQRIELSLTKQKTELELAHLESLREKFEENRKFLHDIKNHLQVLQNLSKIDDGNELNYIESVNEQIKKMELYVECSNKVVETLFNEKISIAKNKSIDFDYSLASIDDLNFINDFDLITIFANILDNAIDSAIATTSPYISFNIKRHNDVIVISVKNTTVNELCIDDLGNVITTKHDKISHGIGLKNVKSCLIKYEGNLDISKKDDMFVVNLFIPIKQSDHNHL